MLKNQAEYEKLAKVLVKKLKAEHGQNLHAKVQELLKDHVETVECEKEALKEITEIASSEETSTEKYDESIAIQANLEHAQQRIQKGESVAT